MSSKIDVTDIIKDHFNTLKVSGKLTCKDFFIFIILPLLTPILFICKGQNLSDAVVSMLVNFGSIFTALLLSLLMLVYEQQNKIIERNDKKPIPFFEAKEKLLRELYSNITFAVSTSMLLVLFSLIHSLADSHTLHLFKEWEFNFKNRFNIYVLTPVLLFLSLNTVLTIFMIIKRTYSLLNMKIK